MPASTYVYFPELNQVAVGSEEVPEGDLGPNEALIRAEASVVSSGTELARMSGLEKNMGTDFPVRTGYAMVGRVEVGGPGLPFAAGQRVFCTGKHATCQRFRHGQGHQWGHLFPVPESLDPADAAVGRLAQIAMTAPEVTDLTLGDTVAVFGLGIVGNLAAQLYQIAGARVIGVDPVPARCELARRCGITTVVDAQPAEQVQAVKAAAGGEGPLVCVDASGVSAVVLNCIKAVAPLGQVVLLGSPRAPLAGDLTEAFGLIHMYGLVVRGAHEFHFPLTVTSGRGRTVRTVESIFATVFDLIASGRLNVRDLISHRVSPDDAPAAYYGLRDRPSEYTGVVIDWGG
jgi:threonine dehydrogenase-like Zn-dependent dehydrogenase